MGKYRLTEPKETIDLLLFSRDGDSQLFRITRDVVVLILVYMYWMRLKITYFSSYIFKMLFIFQEPLFQRSNFSNLVFTWNRQNIIPIQYNILFHVL